MLRVLWRYGELDYRDEIFKKIFAHVPTVTEFKFLEQRLHRIAATGCNSEDIVNALFHMLSQELHSWPQLGSRQGWMCGFSTFVASFCPAVRFLISCARGTALSVAP